MSCIVVLAEHRQGNLRDITFEMLTLAQALARQMNLKVQVLYLGKNNEANAETLANYADEVIVVEDALLANFNSEIYRKVIVSTLAEHKLSLLLLGHTAFGTDLAPGLAYDLNLPLITDCIEITYEDNRIVATRPLYSGKLNARVYLKQPTGVLTIRAGTFKPTDTKLAGIVKKKPLPAELKTGYASNFIGYEEVPTTGIDITKADIIVAVGRGIKEAKNMPIVEELAKTLGGELACTRPVIDAGWLPKDRQVGSSGKTVKPKLYIALGISGAFQHISGMKQSQTIVAVNKDPNAPIFNVAHYGIVGDLLKIVPLLKEKIKEIKGI
ncbi:MAG: electron transfer flavoprotein subunit alpha/FixB family protein [candidate division WOR-3 bacterium]